MEYTFDIVVAFLENYEFIQSFVERTTNELFPIGYDYELFDEFWQEEGNTLLDKGSHNTRVPKRDTLRENLIVMKADIDTAVKVLPVEEQIAVWYNYQLDGLKPHKGNAAELAREAVAKIVEHLNG